MNNEVKLNKIELILKIINFILFAICGISGLILLSDLILFGFISLIISNSVFENINVIIVTITNVIIFFVSLISIVVINLNIKNYLKKVNKFYIGKYKKINKTIYILLTLFLGIFGINKFVIGNIKSGIIRLSFLLLATILININVIPFIIICGLIGLIFSDFVILLTRKIDESNMIYVD